MYKPVPYKELKKESHFHQLSGILSDMVVVCDEEHLEYAFKFKK